MSLELEFDSVPSIGTDNYKAEYALVEHMIEVHGCRTFNFVGGPAEHMENKERYRAFCDCLHAHGLDVDENRVSFWAFRELDGVMAYADFREKGLQIADAVVCANDLMALGYSGAAAEDGYYAPKDYCIVGFDNLEEGQNYYPSITSVGRSWDQRGYDSVELLLNMIDGKISEVFHHHDTKLVLNESCGCCVKKRDFYHDFDNFYKQRYKKDNLESFSRKSRKLLCGSINMEDFQERLAICKETAEISNIAICLNASLFSDSVDVKMDYDDEIKIYTEGTMQIQSRKQSLLPSGWTKEQVYFFSPLHFERINFGYCVIAGHSGWQEKMDHRSFMESICLGIEGIRQHSNLNRMNSRLEEMYVRDSMTGMYNRFGYESFARAYFEQQNGRVYVASLDLDNLKLYNDRFGHKIGDSAIQGVSLGIQYAYGKDTINVRMGGDEFLVIGVYEDDEKLREKEKRLQDYLADYSKKEMLPFSLSVSIGYTTNDDCTKNLDELIWIADHNMYQTKLKKKHADTGESTMASQEVIDGFSEIIEKLPDNNYKVEEILEALRKYVPIITSRYGVLHLEATIVESGRNGKKIQKDVILYDIRGGKKTNDYVIRFETGRDSFVSVTNGIPASEVWTAEMKRDMYILTKSIILLVGCAQAMNALSNLNYWDPLTGIANTRKLNQIMMREFKEGRLAEFCTNFVNIKNMKLFNERNGDKAGDQLLISFSDKIRSYVGERGCIARMGGDNFVVFIEKSREEEFLNFMRELTLNIETPHLGAFSAKVNTRIGYYPIRPGDSISDAMSNSSIAINFVRKDNTSDMLCFEDYMKNSILRIKELEEGAPEALRKKEFVVYYQPKVDISDPDKIRINGGEALIRWKKGNHVILPMEFIQILEQIGLITEIDFCVFERVCSDLREWIDEGIRPVRISSNFSRRHLKDENFADKIEAIIKKYGIDPKYLEIEITESFELEDMELLKKFEQNMHRLGIRLAVDDFGSGFSSIQMIKNIVSDTD